MFSTAGGGLALVTIVGIAAYAILTVILRVSGKCTLSKVNAFHLVVTSALGSTLATILLNDTATLLEGFLALALLVYLQFALTWLSIRSRRFQSLIKSEPALLVHHCQYLDATLRKLRVTREEIAAALRKSGQSDIRDARSVVLETDGSMTVVRRGEAG